MPGPSFILPCFALILACSAAAPAGSTPARPQEPLLLGPGPHLFLDDHLIESAEGLIRQVSPPRRDPANPPVTGREDGNFQPYMTVVRDSEAGRFRLWYNVQVGTRSRSRLGYMESHDGIHWRRPHQELRFPFTVKYGASILDRGPAYPDPQRRFKFAYYLSGGLRIAVSADGLEWRPLSPGVVLPHSHDINNIYWDPLRRRYGANVSVLADERDSLGHRLRTTWHSTSPDLLNWTPPRRIIFPDDRDEPETQFYCMGGVLARGDLLIGMVRVLLDHLPSEPGGLSYESSRPDGIGYTTLAWSRDGMNWERDREPFLQRAPRQGDWDRAIAWIDCQLPVGDEVFLYYAGYERGHKIQRNIERRIGLARMLRDRYVARKAGDQTGTLLTPPLVLTGDRMTLNADAADGRIRVQIIDMQGRPLPGFAFTDCEPITADAVHAAVEWSRPFAIIQDKEVRLEFELRSARLFAFDLHGE